MESAKQKVLIVEDDSFLAVSLSDILTAQGYQVAVAENYEMARPLLSSTDVAVIDLRLPDKPGIELVRELKEMNPEAEALITTGYSEEQSAIDALNLGAFAYLKKPVTPDRLLLLLKRALEKRCLALEIKRREQEIKGLTGLTGNILNERVTLLEQAKEAAERLSRLYHGIALAFHAPGPIEAARKLLPLLAEETKANMVSLSFIGTDRKIIDRVEFFTGMEPFKVKTRDGGTRDEVIRTLRPLVIPDLEKYPNPNADVLARGIKSMIVYPLVVDNVAYATICLSGVRRNAFADMEQIVASFADLCAIPLRQSKIYVEADRASKAWEATVNAMRAGIAIIDGDRTIIRANKTLADMVKVPLQELPGKKICTLIHGNPNPVLECRMEKVCNGSEDDSITMREDFLNIKRLQIRVAPINDNRGEPARFVHIIRDLDNLRYKP